MYREPSTASSPRRCLEKRGSEDDRLKQAAFELPFIPLADARALVELYAENGAPKVRASRVDYRAFQGRCCIAMRIPRLYHATLAFSHQAPSGLHRGLHGLDAGMRRSRPGTRAEATAAPSSGPVERHRLSASECRSSCAVIVSAHDRPAVA